MKVEWNEDHVQIFLDMYEDMYVKHCRSGNISHDNWKTLTADFNSRVNVNPLYTVQRLRNKIDILLRRYKLEKKKQDSTGESPSEWIYFHQFHRIRGQSIKERGVQGDLDGGKHILTKPTVLSDNEIEDDCEEKNPSPVLSPVQERICTPQRSSKDVLVNQLKTLETAEKSKKSKCRKKRRHSPISGKREAPHVKMFIDLMKEIIDVVKESNLENQKTELMKLDLIKEMIELKKRQFEWKTQHQAPNDKEFTFNTGGR